ncbi:MAG TPA: hypothetical protein PLK63_14615 [Catalimonadaceae bacterium]|nr:hypothetical protein [Catalimonadaceae bacterium]
MGKSFVVGRYGWILVLLLAVVPAYVLAQKQAPDSVFSYRNTTQGLAQKWLKKIQDPTQRNFWVNGIFNPYLINRNLASGYADTYGGLSSLSFAPYPNLLSPTVNTLQPTLALSFGGLITENLSFAVDYGFFYNYDSDKTHRVDFSSQNNLVANLILTKSWGIFDFRAGAGVMPIHFSSLTLSNKYIRDPLFDRVPWEYHSNSANRYSSNFQSTGFSPSLFNKTGSQGFYLQATDLPGKLEAKVFYGRTQLNLFPSEALAGTPSAIAAFRLVKNGSNENQMGINFYHNSSWADRVKSFHDLRIVSSIDGKWNKGQHHVKGEAGVARLENPKAGKTTDYGAWLKYNHDSQVLPFGIQVFGMGKNFVCLENEAYNSNPLYQQGGILSDSTYNNFLFPAYLNPAGTMANNRIGIDLLVEKKIRNLSVAVGHQTSRELSASGNVISFPHMVNGYSRSRFTPWQQYTGPYGRIGNRFRMSLERFFLTQDADKIKYMSATFVDLKYRFPTGRRFSYLTSYSSVGSIGTSPLQTNFNLESGFLRTIFQEAELMISVHKSVYLVGYAGWEWNKASQKTQLSSENGNPLNQTGSGYGFGIDFEIAEYTGLYFRHRWMEHTDKSFVLDHFKGQESVVELKISF